MRKTLVFAGILVLATVASACRGAAGSAPTETSPEFTAAAQEAAKSAVLTLDDFPPGWTGAPPDKSDNSNLGVSDECSALELETFPGQVAEAESNEFTGPDEQEVSSAISVFPTDDAAQGAVDAFNDAFDQCRKELEDALTRLIKEGAEEEAQLPEEVELDLQVNVENLSFERFGDATVAYRIPVKASFIGITLEFTIDLVFMREGKVAGGLFYFALGEVDTDEEAQLAETVADKLEQANASLPD